MSRGRLRIDLRSADNVRAGAWSVLARVGPHTVDLTGETTDTSTQWSPGVAGGVLGDGVALQSVINHKLEITVWAADRGSGRPPVRARILFATARPAGG